MLIDKLLDVINDDDFTKLSLHAQLDILKALEEVIENERD